MELMGVLLNTWQWCTSFSFAYSLLTLVVLQANETFAFVGNVTHYAQVWMNMSAEIRSFLEEGRLQQRISRLQQVRC